MVRLRARIGNAIGILFYIVAGVVVGVPLVMSGCAVGTPSDPTVVRISPGGPSVVPGSFELPGERDYFVFTLDAVFQSVTVLTTGATDTAGRVETADRTPVTEYCDPNPHPPCIFSYDADGANFVWTGMLAPGTYYIRVAAEHESVGDYELSVEPSDAIPAGFVPFAPTRLEISPEAATGPDYIAAGSIDSAGEVDYYELVLNQTWNTVTVMTSGTSDTAGQVETWQRMPVTMICVGIRPEAEPPCVWGSDTNIDTPNPDRSAAFNTMEASKNFIWEGKLGCGMISMQTCDTISYYIRVTGEDGATGPYSLGVETLNISCPATVDNPHGYYCDD